MVRNFGKGYRGDSAGHRLNALGVSRGRTRRSKLQFTPGQLLTLRDRSDRNRAASRRPTVTDIPETKPEEFIPDIPDQPATQIPKVSSSVEAINKTSPREESVSFAQPRDSVEGSQPSSSIFETSYPSPPKPPSLDGGEF